MTRFNCHFMIEEKVFGDDGVKVLTFIFVAIMTYILFSFAFSPIADWLEYKKYYPYEYQNKYKISKMSCFLASILLLSLCVIFYQLSREGVSVIISGVLGCIISLIQWIVDILVPKGPMGIITDEKDKKEYLDLDEKISQTNNYLLKEEYKKRQNDIFNKYLGK